MGGNFDSTYRDHVFTYKRSIKLPWGRAKYDNEMQRKQTFDPFVGSSLIFLRALYIRQLDRFFKILRVRQSELLYF